MTNQPIPDPWQLAMEFICFTSQSIFLSGKAGTGKTTFLQAVRSKNSKQKLVLAPTGIAALQADGITIHSFFQFPLEVLDTAFFNKPLPTYKEEKIAVIRQLELLIIDEISMVRADTLDGIDSVLRFYRNKPLLPFGGVQLLLIGDLLQLSPVLSPADITKINTLYPSSFFFESKAVQQADLVKIELTAVYRQSDERFIQLLNNVRTNSYTDEQFAWLNERYSKDENYRPGYILLTTHKIKAETLNRQTLESLPGKSLVLEAMVNGEFPDNIDPAPRRLELKKGARIIFIKNDSGENRRYYNGQAGTVASSSEEKQVITTDDGNLIELERVSWTNRGAKLDSTGAQIRDTELGSFRQFPIKLGWAITIHKSQGMTFENAIIDAGNSFAAGQVYVALSRLRTIGGLILKTPIPREAIFNEAAIIAFLNQPSNNNQLLTRLHAGKTNFRNALLINLFDFEKLNQQLLAFQIRFPDIKHFKEFGEIVAELGVVSVRFESELQHLFSEPGQQQEVITNRTKAAVNYFNNSIENKLVAPLQAIAESLKPIQKNESLKETLGGLLHMFIIKKQEILSAVLVAEGLAGNMSTTELLGLLMTEHNITGDELRLKTQAPVEKAIKDTTQFKTLALFNKGLSIAEIALKRKLNPGIVEDHLCSFIKSGEVKISQLVDQERVAAITTVIQKQPGSSVHEIRYSLGGDFRFGEIRAVLETL